MKRLTKIFQALIGAAVLIATVLIAAGRSALRIIKNRWKKRPKWARRTITAAIIIIAAWYVMKIPVGIYDHYFGRFEWCDRRLADDIFVHEMKDYSIRLYDRQRDKYTTPKLDWISEAAKGDSLIVYSRRCKRGFINMNTGEIIINAKENNYQKAWVFSEGLAAVMQNNKIGFINANNEIVIPFEFDYSYTLEDRQNGYLFHNGYCAMTTADGKIGLIDKNGEWAVEPIYDQLWAPQERGYRVVIKEDKYGLLGPELQMIYQPVYDYVGNHSQEGGFILMKDGRMWQEDYEGNIVHPFMHEWSDILRYPAEADDDYSTEYRMSDYSKYQISQRYGILNRHTGKPLTPAIYESIDMISPTIFEVRPANNYGLLLIDINGNAVKG